jgi:preprotein translocase subunit SecY
MFFRIATVITLTGGTMFLMWLGEQITSRGIGNGISLIIFAGIVAEYSARHRGTLELGRQGASATWPDPGRDPSSAVVVIAFIVFMERAQRRLLIQYPKRQVGNRMFQGQTSHPAAQAEHGRRYPADLRVLAAAAAGNHRQFLANRVGLRAG